MRILAVGNMYPPHSSGGYERVWHASVSHLREQGHTVRVLTTTHRESIDEPDEPDVFRELRWYWRDHEILDLGVLRSARLERRNLRVLDRHLNDFRPDVLAWWSMGAMSMALIEHGRRVGLPAVAFVHDDWLDYGRRVDAWHRRFRRRPRRARMAERLSGIPTRVDFAAAARFAFVSEFTRRKALLTGLALHETEIIHSGIDPSFLEARAPKTSSRPFRWRMLYVGRIDPRKGIATAVEALTHLPAEATLDIVGAGDRRETERLLALARELGVEARLAMRGACPPTDLPGVYAAADVTVFPVTWEEPWGLVPIEAMAVGCPVVATGRGGSGEYLQDGRNCLLFKPGDAADLAAQVTRLAADAELRATLRDGGYPVARRHTEATFNGAVAETIARAAMSGAPLPVAPVPVRAAPCPRLSVVIPTFRRPDALPRTLDALERQHLDRHHFEVLVVDDTDEDNPEEVAAGVRAGARRYDVRLLHRPAPGPGSARNIGWREARGAVVLFLGDDILGGPDLLAQHLAWHERDEDPRTGVLGAIDWASELEITPFMRWLERGVQFEYGSIDGIDAGFGHFYTANISVKRQMLERVGGFDETRFQFGYEDIDLGWRLAEAGFRLLYNRRAHAEHLHPTTIEGWQRRMGIIAPMEREWVALHPELEPYFFNRLSEAAALPPRRGRAVTGLAARVPAWVPRLGSKVREAQEIYFRQQLAPAFLESWDRSAPPTRAGAPRAIE